MRKIINTNKKWYNKKPKEITLKDTIQCEGCDDRLCDISCPIGLAKRK